MKKAVLYHVTKTSSVAKIKKLGIVPMKKSNWVVRGTGKRYGAGEIFAFDTHGDALQWAGRMEWEFFHDIGTGKISIVEFFADMKDWTLDKADPLSQALSEGNWFKSLRSVKPSDVIGAAKVTSEQIRERIRQRDGR